MILDGDEETEKWNGKQKETERGRVQANERAIGNDSDGLVRCRLHQVKT